MAIDIFTIKEKNEETASKTYPQPTAVIVGGTSGLGEHTAYKFAQYNSKPIIYIIGRRASSGARVLAQLCKINPDPDCRFRFYGCDVTLISEVDKICDKIAKQETYVNLLFLSPGFTTLSGRSESAEGLDVKMAVNYYGRFRFVDRLIGLLQAAADKDVYLQNLANEHKVIRNGVSVPEFVPKNVNARVITVLQPGDEAMPILEDLDLKQNYTLKKAHDHFVEFTSLAIMRFARLYPNIGFIHAGPGVVNTGIARSLPLWARIPAQIAMMFANSPDNAAERLYYMASAPEYRKGAHLIDGNNKSMLSRASKRGFLTEELQDTVWKHTEEMFEEALIKISTEKKDFGASEETLQNKKTLENSDTKSKDDTTPDDDWDESASLRSSLLSL